MGGLIAVFNEARLYVVGGLAVVLAVLASAHAILYKRDARAAVAWVGLILLAPIAGALLYVVFGINRIRRAASGIRAEGPRFSGSMPSARPTEIGLRGILPPSHAHLVALGGLVDRVTRRPITLGNAVTPLLNGDETFPAMLEAIRSAEYSVALSTYIFDHDAAGGEFADALEAAQRRGVEVRVLVDGVGSRYSWPPIVRTLKRRGVAVARFMPTYVPWRAPFWNLRNHRKILVVDGKLGFTGGINVRQGHRLAAAPRRPVQDLHFRLTGPVVRHLIEVFAEDWAFTTKEVLDGPLWLVEIEPAGSLAARGITDGPDEDFEKLRWTLHGAIATARRSVHVVTPYFLPDATFVTALDIAALRGVEIQILLPEVNNQPLVHWASRAMLWQIVKRDCHVYYTPPPFDHTKLLVVDGAWTLFGSGNWDPRSLRLNFEFNVECYGMALAEQMEALFAAKRSAGRRIGGAELDGRPLATKLRDGLARLASPYL